MSRPGWTPQHRGRDLDDPVEIAEMVRRFYVDVAQDDLLGPMFNDVARVDWSAHLPKLTEFWCRSLLSIPGYEGNPYRAHQHIHDQRSFTAAQFERWLDLFHETLDLGWSGPKTQQAKAFARKVAMVHSKAIIGEPVLYEPPAPPRQVLPSDEGGDAPCWAHLFDDDLDDLAEDGARSVEVAADLAVGRPASRPVGGGAQQ